MVFLLFLSDNNSIMRFSSTIILNGHSIGDGSLSLPGLFLFVILPAIILTLSNRIHLDEFESDEKSAS